MGRLEERGIVIKVDVEDVMDRPEVERHVSGIELVIFHESY